MVRIPDDDEYRRVWSKLEFKDRRRILKAVNKGQQVESRKEAALAVAVARRQQSFWKKAPLFGPLAALVQIGYGWQAYLVNAVVATALIGALAWWRYQRVARAADRNRDHATGRGRPGSKGHTPGKGRRRGRPEETLPPDAKPVRPGAGEPKRSRRDRKS